MRFLPNFPSVSPSLPMIAPARRLTSANTLSRHFKPSIGRLRPSLEKYHRREAEILPLLMSLPDLVRHPDWMMLQRLDLSYQQVVSTKGLNVLMPNLEELDL